MDTQSLHLKKFNDKVKVMNQSNSKDLILSRIEAQNLQAEIFDLLSLIAELSSTKTQKTEENIDLKFDGGTF